MNELAIQELSNSDLIHSRILTIRGVQVMRDRDLAELRYIYKYRDEWKFNSTFFRSWLKRYA